MSYSLSPGGGWPNGGSLQCWGWKNGNLHRHRRHAETAESQGRDQHPVIPLSYQTPAVVSRPDTTAVCPHTRHSR